MATKLNLIPAGAMPVVYVNQYDFGIQRTFEIYKGPEVFAIPAGYSVTLRATKPDGYGIVTAGEYIIGQNVVRVVIPQQLTAVPGKTICELVFLNSATVRVGTINFVLAVEPAAMSDDTVISDSDISYIEEAVDRIGNVDVIKAQSVENARDLADPGYYNGLAVSTGVYENENGVDTSYYIVTIPPLDPDGDPIPIEAAYDPSTTPLTHAQKELTTLTTNSSLDFNQGAIAPAVIHDGEIIRESTFDPVISQYPYVVYVGFDSQRVPHEYPITTAAAAMVADGIKEASVAYYRLVIDGAARDVSDIGLTPAQLRVNPRIAMYTKADGSLCFLACDGRDGSNEGLTPSELAGLMVENGAVQGWNLDGGGSTSLVLKGSKLNRNIDGDGTRDRGARVTWNIPHKYENPAIQEAFANTGIEKQRTIVQLIETMHTNSIRIVDSVTLTGLSDGIYYVNNAQDSPTTVDDGYAWALEKYTSSLNLKKVYWMPYSANTIYCNSYNGSTWTGWIALDVVYGLLRQGVRIPANSDLDDYTIPGTYYIANATDAATIGHVPATNLGLKVVVEFVTSGSAISQRAFNANGNEFIRYCIANVWGNWRNLAIAKGLTATIPAGGKVRISGLNYSRGMILVSGTGANAWGSCTFVKSSTSAIHLMNVDCGSATTIALTDNNQVIEITNGYSATTQGLSLVLFGTNTQLFDVTIEAIEPV